VVFDHRSFRHQTNPLFVELNIEGSPASDDAILENVGTKVDKGKGRVG